jgi:RNA polymerase sigma factor (sigma-70 family)
LSFPTTHWSVLSAASLSGSTEARQALERLCDEYRPAVLEFLRCQGGSGEDPEDVTQEFFARLLTARAWKRANRSKGRFRSFLLGALKHHLADVHRRRQAGKRGGQAEHIPWEELGEDFELGQDEAKPDLDRVFDRSWAETIVSNALEQTAQEMERAGEAERFLVLAVYLQAEESGPSYEQAASSLGTTVAGVKSEVHRLRKQFRLALRHQVARTVSAPHEIDGELTYLIEVLSASGSAN